MPIQVLCKRQNANEEWLQLNDDGSFTHTRVNLDVRRARNERTVAVLSERDAKARFPDAADEIDAALQEQKNLQPRPDPTAVS